MTAHGELVEPLELLELLERLEQILFASGITNSARVETGNKEKILTERLCLLTCLLMGDPQCH
jgi:hypothetical protein